MAGCDDSVGKESAAAENQKSLGEILLGRGLDTRASTFFFVLFFAESSGCVLIKIKLERIIFSNVFKNKYHISIYVWA